MCLTYYPVTFNDQLGRPMRRKRFVATPGVGAASDGLVGLGCGTGQQWLDFCVLVGHPEWMEDQSLFLDRTALTPTIDAWIADRTVEEVLGEASAFRIPNAPITNGANATTWAHFRRAGDVRRQSQGRRDEPRTTLPAGGGEAPGTRGGTPPRRAAERRGGDAGAAGARATSRERRASRRCPSRACGSST